MTQVMISYRKIDGQREFAYTLEKELAQAGLKTWIDINNIPPFSRWEDEIFDGIKDSDFVILCLSPDYFESEICLLECYVARGYGKKLLPIVVPYAEPTHSSIDIFKLCYDFEETKGIENINPLDFQRQSIVGLEENHEAMIKRLIQSIKNPISSEIDYDVFMSFKWQHANFATQIADDLNAAGIRTFIHTRGIDIGADWRQVSWNVSLKAKVHIIIISPEIAESQYISKEVLLSRTKQTTFVPILPEEFVNDEAKKSQIRQALASNMNLDVLNKYQWLMPDKGYELFLETLIAGLKQQLGLNN